jgi:hypothetical protein
MTEHSWETTRCSRYVRRDECQRCGARRTRELWEPDGEWAYLRGSETCEPVIDPSPAERAVMTEGRE